MKKLSKESAERHYKKLIEIHYSECLTLAQKVSVFQQDLEHEILKEITGKREYYDQLNLLKDNQKRVINGKEHGSIPPAYVSDIENLKKWRNRGVHEDDMPKIKYRNHFHTMAQTICFFSEIPIKDEINNILDEKKETKILNQRTTGRKLKNDNEKLGIIKSIDEINKRFALNINNNNTQYSSIHKSLKWGFDIDNSKFNEDFNIILEDQYKKILYYFQIKKGSIKDPKKIFYQRKDSNNKSQIEFKDENNDFKEVRRGFQFGDYLYKKFNYLE